MAGDIPFKNESRLIDGYTIAKCIGYLGLAGIALLLFTFGFVYVSDALQAPQLKQQLDEKEAKLSLLADTEARWLSHELHYAVNITDVVLAAEDDPFISPITTTVAHPDAPAAFSTLKLNKDIIPLNGNTTLTLNVRSNIADGMEKMAFHFSILPEGLCDKYLEPNIDSKELVLPPLESANAQTGDMTVTFTAVDVPAKAVTCEIDARLIVDGQEVDGRRLFLTAYRIGDE